MPAPKILDHVVDISYKAGPILEGRGCSAAVLQEAQDVQDLRWLGKCKADALTGTGGEGLVRVP